MFYVGRQYSAARSGEVVKQVCCEKCGEDYLYRMIRRGEGRGTSAYYLNNRGAENRANQRATSSLKKRLARGIDPVPCPDCGWLQTDMVREIRRRQHRWMNYLAIGIVALFGLIIALYLLDATRGGDRPLKSDDQVVLMVMGAIGVVPSVGLWLLRRWLLSRSNPNRLHPLKPALIPGAPKAFKATDNLFAPPPLPAIEADGLSYARTPPEVEPGGWVTVQLLNPPVPQACCDCMCQTKSTRIYGPSALVKMPVRICSACLRAYRFRMTTWVVSGMFVAASAVFGLTFLASRISIEERVAYPIVGAIFGSIIGFAIARTTSAPVTLGRFDSTLNTLRIRFKNRNYLSVFVAAGETLSLSRPELSIAIPRPGQPRATV